MGLDWLTEGQNIARLGAGLWLTAKISFISVGVSCITGTLFGLLMRSCTRWVRVACQIYLETIRIVPILVWLFVLYFGLPTWTNWHISGQWVCISGFSLWGTAEMGDLVRGALGSIERHQIFRYIELPQGLRRVLPGAINLFTRMVKTSSLAALVGVVEIIKVGQQIIENSLLTVPNASLWVYGLIFVLYFLICYPLSLVAARLERKWEC